MEVHPVQTSFQSPWQNGVAERWVGSCRRELLDHVIVMDEPHLRRLLCEFLAYYHGDRTHLLYVFVVICNGSSRIGPLFFRSI